MTYKELYDKYGKIEIKCKGADSLPIDAIMDFQGSLKKRTKQNKLKLATLMFTHGFIAPFFVWDNKGDYINLDGHCRSDVLCEIREAGIPIPGLFPVSYIFADKEQDAREKLLSISSQFGQWELSELDEWLENIDNDIKEQFRFLEKEIKTEIQIDFAEPNEDAENIQRKEIILCVCPKCGYEWQK